MRWGPPHLSQCRSSGTKINSWNGVWIGHGCRMMVVLLFDYHPIDHLQPEPLAFYRAVVVFRWPFRGSTIVILAPERTWLRLGPPAIGFVSHAGPSAGLVGWAPPTASPAG